MEHYSQEMFGSPESPLMDEFKKLIKEQKELNLLEFKNKQQNLHYLQSAIRAQDSQSIVLWKEMQETERVETAEIESQA